MPVAIGILAVPLMNEIVVLVAQSPVLCSMAGHRLPSKELTFYTATKHAVTALTEGLKRELVEAKSHIRISVNNSATCTAVLTTVTIVTLVLF